MARQGNSCGTLTYTFRKRWSRESRASRVKNIYIKRQENPTFLELNNTCRGYCCNTLTYPSIYRLKRSMYVITRVQSYSLAANISLRDGTPSPSSCNNPRPLAIISSISHPPLCPLPTIVFIHYTRPCPPSSLAANTVQQQTIHHHDLAPYQSQHSWSKARYTIHPLAHPLQPSQTPRKISHSEQNRHT